VKIVLFGRDGKVGSVVAAGLGVAGHEVTGVRDGETPSFEGTDAAVDFTTPDATLGNVSDALGAGVPCVVGTTGISNEGLAELDRIAGDGGVPCFVAPNFAIGAVLMMRYAEDAFRHMTHAEIVELHHETKLDAPSGTAKATAARMGGGVPIHSVRLPGLVAHQEVILGGPGQTLTIRHDTTSREAFVPGVLLALGRLHTLPPGLTIGLDALL
jgi:4-hydroxy-tetrahydrodipicolinate reductase